MRVYELDIEMVTRQLLESLERERGDVVEQAPAGVWWLHTEDDVEEVGRRVSTSFHDILLRALREVPQSN